jgi:WD40 repeat protein
MNDAFISYSRKDTDFVRTLHQALNAANKEIWVDWEGIPLTSDWRAEIYQGMEQAHAVIFVMSPDFLASRECGVELNLAAEMNKRLIPLVYRDVVPKKVPPTLASLNWIFCREEDDFDQAIIALNTALDTDLDWVKAHTRLLVRSTEWDKRNRNDSFLLRGTDLQEAEQMLAQSSKQPALTTLQRHYILASRQRANKVQGAILAAVTFGFIVAVILAVAAFFQYREAEHQRGQADQNALKAETARETAEAERDRAATAEVRAISGEREARKAQSTAEAERAEAIRQSRISLAKSLVAQSVPIIQRNNDTELALLLAVEAGRLNREFQGDAQALTANNLRYILSLPDFNTILRLSTTALFVAFSPDGRTLALAGENGTIQLWDMDNLAGTPRILTGHEDRVSTLAFSPDGHFLVSGSDDGVIQLWDMSQPALNSAKLEGHTRRILALAFSPDSRWLASAGDDTDILLRQLDDPLNPKVLSGYPGTILALAFSPSGQTLASAGSDTAIRLWNLNRLAIKPTLLEGHQSSILSLSFSNDGQLLASGSADKTVRVWNVSDPLSKPVVLQGHTGGVGAVAFSPRGYTLASAGLEKMIKLWALSDWSTLTTNQASLKPTTLTGHENTVYALAFSPDGQTLTSTSADQTARLWPMSPPIAKPKIFTGHDDWVEDIAFGPDSRLLASVSDDTTVRIWDITDPIGLAETLGSHDDLVKAVAVSPNGQTVASAGADFTVRLWSVADTQSDPKVLDVEDEQILALAFSPACPNPAEGCQQWLAAAGSEQTIRLWNLGDLTTEPIALTGHEDKIRTLAFSPDGRTLASGSFDQTIRLWDLTSLADKPRILERHRSGVLAVAFSPDGQALASGSNDGAILLWNMADLAAKPFAFSEQEGSVLDLVFSPDGLSLASSSAETIKLWDLLNPTAEPTTLSDHTDKIFALSFSPDGATLASAGADQTIRLWLARSDSLNELACQQVRRNLKAVEWRQFLGNLAYNQTCPNLPFPPDTVSLK